MPGRPNALPINPPAAAPPTAPMPAPFSLVVMGPPAHPAAINTTKPRVAMLREDFLLIVPPIRYQLPRLSLMDGIATPVPFSLPFLTHGIFNDRAFWRRPRRGNIYWRAVKLLGSGSAWISDLSMDRGNIDARCRVSPCADVACYFRCARCKAWALMSP